MKWDMSKAWKILTGVLIFVVVLSFLPGVVTGMSIAQALNYLLGQGYYAYADPDYNWAVTGDTSIGGDLDVTGDGSFGGNLDVTGNITGNVDTLTTPGTAGETMLDGNLCFQYTDGKWYRSDADVSANCTPRMAMAMSDASADEVIEFLEYGYKTNTDWTVTMGVPLFASATTGNFTETAPVSGIVRIIGYGTDNANKIKVIAGVNPDWLELE